MTSEAGAPLHEISPPKSFAGGITVRVVRAGWFRPDAGGFFGVVPKPLWSRFVDRRTSAGGSSAASTCCSSRPAGTASSSRPAPGCG